jgi:serine/threonine-protein kinase
VSGSLYNVESKREEDPVGRVIAGSYRLTGLLGVGAMGKVFRAEELERGTEVAIKLLRTHLGANKEAAARFRREAFVGVKLVHPNCVPVLDFGTVEDGSCYLVMELVRGESLGDVLDREGRLPWRRALHIARHVLRGLDHAHREGVVHRDIKPDNIFLCEQDGDRDFARILDFGIAKLVGDAAGAAITQAGITVGTPNYVSPEQATATTLDGRSDLYSLSCVLYEMLVGKPPFGDREALRTVLAHATEPPPTFAAIAPDVDIPEDVEALVRDGLAKRPDDRIGSASEYILRIDELVRVEEAPAAPVEPEETIAVQPDASIAVRRAPERRGRTRILALAAVVVTVVAATLLFVLPLDERAIAPPRIERARRAPVAAPMAMEVQDAIAKLENGKTCAIRRAAVKRLGELADARAVPALEKARSRPWRGKNANACLQKDLDAALKALRRRP